MTLYERIDANFTPEPNTGCWIWQAYVSLKLMRVLATSRLRREKQVFEIRQGIESGATTKELASMFGVTTETIRYVTKRGWRHV